MNGLRRDTKLELEGMDAHGKTIPSAATMLRSVICTNDLPSFAGGTFVLVRISI